MVKRAQFYLRKPCPTAEEAKSFLEEHGVVVNERDLTARPLTRRELVTLLGYQDPRHYVDPTSPSFKKMKLDKGLPSREEMLNMIVENPDLLRNPIILAGRLMTIGTRRQQLIDMFQITVSGNGSEEPPDRRGRR
jgi:regulatory protein spx